MTINNFPHSPGLLKSIREVLVASMQKAVQPRLRPCGFVDDTEPDNRMRIACFDSKKVRYTDEDGYEIEGIELASPGFYVGGIIGFSKHGIIVGTCPCITTHAYEGIPVEALIRLEQIAHNILWEKR